MKAIVQDSYGPPAAVLRLADIERPTVGEGEVLVRVRASCVHPDVWHAVTGRPWVLRLVWAGLLRPRNRVPGMEVAGVVEAVGAGVTRFEVGDEVFGPTYRELRWCNAGAFAEYAVAPETVLACKPESVSFEQAASVPTSGFIALLNLRGGAAIEPGRRILINGAGGGVGTTALQIAKASGAHVTAVDHEAKLQMLKSLGADETVDYTRDDFTRAGKRYDLILDVASTLTLTDAKRALTEDGVYLVIGHDHFGRARGRVLGSIPRMIALMLRARFDPHLPRSEGTPPPTVAEAMTTLAGYLEEGSLTPVIDRAFPLAEAADAIAYLESERPSGRVVVVPGEASA